LEARLADLQGQQRSLPGLERRLVDAQTRLGLREQKQVVLLDLIAGRDRIQTFLALLGQEARASGVEIRRYEPLDRSSLQQRRPNGGSRSSQQQSLSQPKTRCKSWVITSLRSRCR
jgi:type IV pilus assembly protein PilO